MKEDLRKKVFIIAEAGVNHNGQLDLAFHLIDAAIAAGADAVKFQTFKAETLVSRQAPKAGYQLLTTDKNQSQYDMLKHLELSPKDHQKLFTYCQQKKIYFLSSPFDLSAIDFLNHLGLDIFKIPSGEITHLPYLEKIGQLNKQVFLSTGMATLDEVKTAVHILMSAGTPREKITVLHCNTQYPTPYQDVNLKALITMKNSLQVATGYSDHTPGIEIPIAAVALGAEVIEKHFTLDRNMTGPDHQASIEPTEFKQMVQAIRHIETALGTGLKIPSPSEKQNIPIVRKSIVAAIDIKKDEQFSTSNIIAKRPALGLSPMEWYRVIGQKAPRDFKKDEPIEI